MNTTPLTLQDLRQLAINAFLFQKPILKAKSMDAKHYYAAKSLTEVEKAA